MLFEVYISNHSVLFTCSHHALRVSALNLLQEAMGACGCCGKTRWRAKSGNSCFEHIKEIRQVSLYLVNNLRLQESVHKKAKLVKGLNLVTTKILRINIFTLVQGCTLLLLFFRYRNFFLQKDHPVSLKNTKKDTKSILSCKFIV